MSLLLDSWDSLNRIEHLLLLNWIFDISVQQKGISLRVNVLHHQLK